MQTLTEFSQKQSATFMKIQGQTYQVIDDADWIGLSTIPRSDDGS